MAKLGRMKFKSFSWQRLSENIRQLILCPHKIQLYHSFFHLFSDEMMSDVDVFRPGVLNVVAAKSYGTLVVTVQEGAIVQLTNLSQGLSTADVIALFLTTEMICICVCG
ncbi:hypothetical protein Tco_1124324 [Tanacetum coccineum]|uniref:Uncharacterized protein n=1 Tax=Tanacetum coccineum TaxID=301880 RepID=A0ABQ5J659_9ASTR